MHTKSIQDINIKKSRILIRVDYNVPIKDGIVVDDYRIQCSMETIKYCLENSCSIVIMSHIGRPKQTGDNRNLSMRPVYNHLKLMLDNQIFFSDDCVSSESIEISSNLKEGEIHILENLRFHRGEKDNDYSFAKLLSQHGQIYINDAFGTSHRAHASNNLITQFFKQKGIGFLLKKEISYLVNHLDNPQKPLCLIIGGAKIDGKIDLIDNFINKIDFLLIGGAMAFTFLKAKGTNIGLSLYQDDKIEYAANLMNKLDRKNIPTVLPIDILASRTIDTKPRHVLINKIDDNEGGFDIGPETCKLFGSFIAKSKTLIWNGPMGVAEVERFKCGTEYISSCINSATKNKNLTSIVGGGDTVASIDRTQINFSHLSTGGGASLELLSGNKLVGIEVIDNG